LLPERLDQPRRWAKPRRIFVNSMSDLFHKDVPDEYIAQVWQVMATTPRHTYQILTKRPARMRSWLNRCARWDGYITHNGEPVSSYGGSGLIVGYPDAPVRRPGWDTGPRGGKLRYKPEPVSWGWPLPNVWLGVSVESQQWADIRIPALLDTPAAVRFLSCEPLLGPVNLRTDLMVGMACDPPDGIGWVIAGGESGPGARPMHPDWARSLRDQCQAADVPFLFKQWGEWRPLAGNECAQIGDEWPAGTRAGMCRRIGKKAAGRELDGRTWDEYPSEIGVAS
jgi:protein gp37